VPFAKPSNQFLMRSPFLQVFLILFLMSFNHIAFSQDTFCGVLTKDETSNGVVNTSEKYDVVDRFIYNVRNSTHFGKWFYLEGL
jgi:hypothetical protein